MSGLDRVRAPTGGKQSGTLQIGARGLSSSQSPRDPTGAPNLSPREQVAAIISPRVPTPSFSRPQGQEQSSPSSARPCPSRRPPPRPPTAARGAQPSTTSLPPLSSPRKLAKSLASGGSPIPGGRPKIASFGSRPHLNRAVTAEDKDRQAHAKQQAIEMVKELNLCLLEDGVPVTMREWKGKQSTLSDHLIRLSLNHRELEVVKGKSIADSATMSSATITSVPLASIADITISWKAPVTTKRSAKTNEDPPPPFAFTLQLLENDSSAAAGGQTVAKLEFAALGHEDYGLCLDGLRSLVKGADHMDFPDSVDAINQLVSIEEEAHRIELEMEVFVPQVPDPPSNMSFPPSFVPGGQEAEAGVTFHVTSSPARVSRGKNRGLDSNPLSVSLVDSIDVDADDL
eukprot:TRINITY_DN2762_c0_g1_i2.p1 TRINITY_DN2762_c0_g1~~TRINITY_DN2762_c0_g1_i2.p1  ORF type:complete len:400 (-),score=51.68 TRINITY_DN2762_c0_g1_i2:107-1306(-)